MQPQAIAHATIYTARLAVDRERSSCDGFLLGAPCTKALVERVYKLPSLSPWKGRTRDRDHFGTQGEIPDGSSTFGFLGRLWKTAAPCLTSSLRGQSPSAGGDSVLRFFERLSRDGDRVSLHQGTMDRTLIIKDRWLRAADFSAVSKVLSFLGSAQDLVTSGPENEYWVYICVQVFG